MWITELVFTFIIVFTTNIHVRMRRFLCIIKIISLSHESWETCEQWVLRFHCVKIYSFKFSYFAYMDFTITGNHIPTIHTFSLYAKKLYYFSLVSIVLAERCAISFHDIPFDLISYVRQRLELKTLLLYDCGCATSTWAWKRERKIKSMKTT